MTFLPRSGLFGFLLLLGALAPTGALAGQASPDDAPPAAQATQQGAAAADDSVEARLSRISAALRERDLAAIADPGEANGRQAVDGKLAWVFANGGGGFRNGGFRNGGFLNGGGFRNGGFYNGGFRNGGFLNGGGFRNGGGWRNYW
jgi:rSAM-associated Gly-rich repeat protein